MNNWLKYSLLFTGIFIAVKGVTKATTLRSLVDKYKINVGMPQIFRVNFANTVIDIKNTTIVNQSNVAVAVRNLYVSIKYTDAANQLQDLLVQTEPVQPFTISAYAQSVVPNIRLTMPNSNIAAITRILAGTLSPKLTIITRAQIAGTELELNSVVDSAAYLQPIKNLLV